MLIWREATEELEQPDFWAKYDIPQIVSRATMLDVRNTVLGFHQQEDAGPSIQRSTTPSAVPGERGRISRPPSIRETALPEAESAEGAPLSSSLETVHPVGASPEPVAPTRLKVSLSGMVATSVALKSGLDIEVVDASTSWASTLFPLQPRTRSPSRVERDSSQPLEEVLEVPGTPLEPELEPSGDGTIPKHVAQAISALQREVLLLKNDLNLELWTARENVKHIGRLYKERVLSRNEEVERQGLVSCMFMLDAL